MSFGENIRKIRKLRGLAQKELAAKSGVASTIISRIESGKQKSTLDNLRKLADALYVSTDWLLDRDDFNHRPHKLLSVDDIDLIARFEQMLLDRRIRKVQALEKLIGK